MKKRILGRTGFEITEIGFGAWSIGDRNDVSIATKSAGAQEMETISQLRTDIEESLRLCRRYHSPDST